MMKIFLFGVLFCVLGESDGIRCFECKNVPLPRDCAKMRDCDSDENCFTEQVVTTSGHVVYNSGCLSKSRCETISTSLIGKRMTNMTEKRSTDLITCTECCTDDFCNMKGCGTLEVPLNLRGPYCYTCDTLDPRDCTNVAVCAQHERCMTHVPVEFISLPETVYRGQCETQATCDAMSEISRHGQCYPMCCSTDFCNDRCDPQTHVNTTTSYPHTTDGTTHKLTAVPSTQKSTVRSTKGATTSKPTTLASSTPRNDLSTTSRNHISHCENDNAFTLLRNSHAELCVHIIKSHTKDWHDARQACHQQGGDLVVLDMHSKAILLRNYLERHSSRYNNTLYWIGAKDFKNDNTFLWVNDDTVNDHEADWNTGQPDHFLGNTSENCVCMTCDALSTISSHEKCTPMCCSSDFCNDHCSKSSYVITTT